MKGTLYWETSVDKRGRLHQWKEFVAALVRFAGFRVIIRVQKWTPRRSIAANNYYWGYIVEPIAEYTGYTKDEVHDILKMKFAPEVFFIHNEVTDLVEEYRVPKSTRTMTKSEFAQYIDNCENFAVNLGIQLPAFTGDKYAYAEDK